MSQSSRKSGAIFLLCTPTQKLPDNGLPGSGWVPADGSPPAGRTLHHLLPSGRLFQNCGKGGQMQPSSPRRAAPCNTAAHSSAMEHRLFHAFTSKAQSSIPSGIPYDLPGPGPGIQGADPDRSSTPPILSKSALWGPPPTIDKNFADGPGILPCSRSVQDGSRRALVGDRPDFVGGLSAERFPAKSVSSPSILIQGRQGWSTQFRRSSSLPFAEPKPTGQVPTEGVGSGNLFRSVKGDSRLFQGSKQERMIFLRSMGYQSYIGEGCP